MKMLRATLIAFGSCALAATMFAPAYIKFDGVDGESKAKGHEKWIELQSFSAAEAQAAAREVASGQASGKRDAASGQATGKRQHKPFTIVKTYDKASPVLAKAMASGEVIKLIEVSDGTTVHKLRDCVITSISPVSSSGGDRPMESISLNYEKIESVPAPKSKATDAALRESPTRASAGKTTKTEKAP